MTREENLHWIDEEIRTWENECQSKHPIKEALYAARKALEQEPCEDAVSVTSVFEIMGNLLSIPYDFDRSITEKDVSESMDKIRELPRVTPQEPFMNKACVSSEVCEHDKQKVLDKIRERVELEKLGYPPSAGYYKAIMKVLQIFDKYKAESEEEK